MRKIYIRTSDIFDYKDAEKRMKHYSKLEMEQTVLNVSYQLFLLIRGKRVLTRALSFSR